MDGVFMVMLSVLQQKFTREIPPLYFENIDEQPERRRSSFFKSNIRI